MLPNSHKWRREGNLMKTIKIGEKEYTLEFSFEAAENKNVVQKMFNVLSGADIAKNATDDESGAVGAMLKGVSEMFASIPDICKDAFYAGLLENNPVSQDESKQLMRQYMKENKVSYSSLFEDIKQCMEDDGFFDLTGLKEMVKKMSASMEENAKKTPKQPQDHKKKSTSTN